MKNNCLIIFLILNYLLSFGQKECVKVSTIIPIDTVYQTEDSHNTLFLIESLSDTIELLHCSTECACETCKYNYKNKIFPGNPDTVIITTSIRHKIGQNKLETNIKTDKCKVAVFTNFYVSDKTIKPSFKLESFKKYNELHPAYADEINYELLFKVKDNSSLDARTLESNFVVINWTCEKIGTGYIKVTVKASREWVKKDDKFSFSLVFNRNIVFDWKEE